MFAFCLFIKPKLISFTIRLSFSAAAVQLPSKRARINKANKWMKHFGRNIPQIFATKYIWCMVALSNRRAARAKQLTFFIALERKAWKCGNRTSCKQRGNVETANAEALGWFFYEPRSKYCGVVQQGSLSTLLQFERAALSSQNRLRKSAKRCFLDSTVALSRLSLAVLELGSPQIQGTSHVSHGFVG